MNPIRILVLAATAAALIAAPATHADTFVSGNQSGSWTVAGNPYIVTGSVTVPPGQTLTLDAGVRVRVQSGMFIQVLGTLVSNGTQPNRVIITSSADTAGGSPTPGSWVGVLANNGSIVNLNHTDLHYGGAAGLANLATGSGQAASVIVNGGGSYHSAGDGVRVISNSVAITGSQASNNAGDGWEIASATPPAFVASGAYFNGGYAFRITQNPGSLPGDFFGSGNTFDAIQVTGTVGGLEPAAKWTWASNITLRYVVDGALNLTNADTLEIGTGAVVKCTPNAQIVASGSGTLLRTRANSGQPVYLTSIRDDQIGGDTNGDGTATQPARGDWVSVFANGGARVDLQWTYFRYGGGGGWANLSSSSFADSLTWIGGGSTFSANDGVRMICTNSILNLLDFSDNALDGLELTPTNPPVFPGFMNGYRNGGYVVRITQNPGSFPGQWLGANNGRNAVFVGGTLGGPLVGRTWTWPASGLPYVIGNLQVNDTLEIAANTTVKFELPSSFLHLNGGAALLRTQGTGLGPVWFTSLRDDARGGDTNNDGGATSPAPGDWQAIFVNLGASVQCTETWLGYGGSGSWPMMSSSNGVAGTVVWNGGGARSSATDGIRVGGAFGSFANLQAVSNAGDGLELSFTNPPVLDQIACVGNSGYGIRMPSGVGSLPSTLSGGGNGVNGVYVSGNLGGSAPNQRWTWAASDQFPAVVANLTISAPDTLEVAAGAVVKFESNSAFLQVTGAAGRLVASGTPDDPVWFTSLRNDAQGGDTNADGTATVAAPGDWVAIFVNNGSQAAFTDTWVTHGGAAGWSNLSVSSGPGTLMWTRGGSMYSGQSGIAGAMTTNLSGVRLTDNVLHGANISPATASSAVGCDIHANGGSGFVNFNSAITVDATGSWWGDATGPFDPSVGPPDHNPGGLGDQVSDWVAYRAWASGPVANMPPTTDVPGDSGPEDGVRTFRVVGPYPNPSRGAATLALTLPRATTVQASVYDVGGRVIRRLAGGPMESGERSIVWDCRSTDGTPARAGLYFMRLVAGAHTVTRKIVVER